jgi:hypothetical protein
MSTPDFRFFFLRPPAGFAALRFFFFGGAAAAAGFSFFCGFAFFRAAHGERGWLKVRGLVTAFRGFTHFEGHFTHLFIIT